MTPSKIEYAIGTTIHGQPLRLVRSQSTGGKAEWILFRDAVNQRDDSTFIAGLTPDVIRAMSEAVMNSYK